MKLLLVLSCILLCFHATAQGNADSLLQQLPSKQGTERINALSQLSKSIRTRNADSAKQFALQALQLSKKQKYTYGELNATNKLAAVHVLNAKYDSTIILAGTVLANPEAKDDAIRAESYGSLAAANWHLGKPDDAIMNYMRSADLWQKQKNMGEYGGALVGIGYVYQSQNKLAEAEKYIKLGLEAIKTSDNVHALANAYHALANTYGMNNKFKEALAIDSIGLELAYKNNIDFSLSMFYDNMANCYMYSGDFDKSYELFKKCIPLDEKRGNNKQLSDTYLNLGNLFLMQNKPDAAIRFLDSSIILADASGYKQGKQNSLQLLSDAYKAKGDDKKALEYLNKMIVVKDSLVSEAREKKIVELQSLYETDKREKELLLQKEQLSKQRYIMIGISALFVMVVVLMYMLYRRRQLKQEARLQTEIIKQQDIATQSVLEAEEKERKRIAGDLHDGVGQMMSAVKMNLSSLASKIQLTNEHDAALLDKTILLVDESCKEVRSVSHNMMPNALLKAGLSSAVKEFIDKIDHSKLQVNLYTEGLQQRMANNVETVLYRVIQEIVNNVIKHAEANQLDISLIKDADGISCTVEDNGKGFDFSSTENVEGIGLKNIQTRINYLKGTVEWDSSTGKGTLVAIHVPF
jgi:two-component system NarL family sensor kinase